VSLWGCSPGWPGLLHRFTLHGQHKHTHTGAKRHADPFTDTNANTGSDAHTDEYTCSNIYVRTAPTVQVKRREAQ